MSIVKISTKYYEKKKSYDILVLPHKLIYNHMTFSDTLLHTSNKELLNFYNCNITYPKCRIF